MSYSCTIGFKEIKPENLYEFLLKFKSEIKNHMEELAETEYMFHPISKDFHYDDIDEAVKDYDYMYKGADWAKEYVFKYRWFYMPEHNIVGVFSIDKCLNYLFDNVSYFQNSCDQNYDFEDWNGLKLFEDIAKKWKNMSEDEVKKAFYSDDWHDEDDTMDDADYYRKSYCYDEIWKMVGKYLEDESSVVYLSLFGSYELFELTQFSSMCIKKYQAWVHKMNEEYKRGNKS